MEMLREGQHATPTGKSFANKRVMAANPERKRYANADPETEQNPLGL